MCWRHFLSLSKSRSLSPSRASRLSNARPQLETSARPTTRSHTRPSTCSRKRIGWAIALFGVAIAAAPAQAQITVNPLPSLDDPSPSQAPRQNAQPRRPANAGTQPWQSNARRFDRREPSRSAPIGTSPRGAQSADPFQDALARVDFSGLPWSEIERATNPAAPAGPGAILAPLRQAVLRRYLADEIAAKGPRSRAALAAAEALARSGDLEAVAAAFPVPTGEPAPLDAVSGTAALIAGRALLGATSSSLVDCRPFEDWNNAVVAGGDVPQPIARRLFRLAAICAMATTPQAPLRAGQSNYRTWARLTASAGQTELADDLTQDAKSLDAARLDPLLATVLRANKPVTLARGLILLHFAAERSTTASLVIASRSAPELAAAMVYMDWLAVRTRLAASIALGTRGRLPRPATQLFLELATDPAPPPAVPQFDLLSLQPGDPRALDLLLDLVTVTLKAAGQDCRASIQAASATMRVAGRLRLERGAARVLQSAPAARTCLTAAPRVALGAGQIPGGLTRDAWHWQALVDLRTARPGQRPTASQRQVIDLNILAPTLADRFGAAVRAQERSPTGRTAGFDTSRAANAPRTGPAAALLAVMTQLSAPAAASGMDPARFERLLATLHANGLHPIAGALAVAALLPAWPQEVAALRAR